MKTLNKIAYHRLIAQAEEAKELGLPELSNNILSSIGPTARSEGEVESYSATQLQQDLEQGLWKLAVKVMIHHDLERVDAIKVAEIINDLSDQFLSKIEDSLDVSGKVGQSEPKLFGEK